MYFHLDFKSQIYTSDNNSSPSAQTNSMHFKEVVNIIQNENI